MSLGYATVNRLNNPATLAATAFTWSNGATANRAYLNDGSMGYRFEPGSVASGISVVIDFGGSWNIGVAATLNSNIGEAGSPTLKVEAADNSGMSTNLVTAKAASALCAGLSAGLTTIDPRAKDHALQFPGVNKRYWRLTWTWSGTFALKIAEIWLGSPALAISRNGIYGASGEGTGEGAEYLTTNMKMQYGESRGMFLGGPVRRAFYSWSDFNPTERNELRGIFLARRGNVSKLLWLPNYESTASAAAEDYQDCIYGKFEAADQKWSEKDFRLYDVDGFEVRSLGREVGA